MSSPGYVWEKLYLAIDCLCGKGAFVERLENATVSALIRLEDPDLTGDLGDDFKFIMRWTRDNIVGGKLQKEPDELERKKLVEKMLRVMLETHGRPRIG